MNTPALIEVAPLPSAVTSLLDSFVHSHSLRDVKVWSRANGEWTCVYPRDDSATYAEGPSHRRVPVELESGAELQIDIDGDDISDADLRFLGDAIRQALSYER